MRWGQSSGRAEQRGGGYPGPDEIGINLKRKPKYSGYLKELSQSCQRDVHKYCSRHDLIAIHRSLEYNWNLSVGDPIALVSKSASKSMLLHPFLGEFHPSGSQDKVSTTRFDRVSSHFSRNVTATTEISSGFFSASRSYPPPSEAYVVIKSCTLVTSTAGGRPGAVCPPPTPPARAAARSPPPPARPPAAWWSGRR